MSKNIDIISTVERKNFSTSQNCTERTEDKASTVQSEQIGEKFTDSLDKKVKEQSKKEKQKGNYLPIQGNLDNIYDSSAKKILELKHNKFDSELYLQQEVPIEQYQYSNNEEDITLKNGLIREIKTVYQALESTFSVETQLQESSLSQALKEEPLKVQFKDTKLKEVQLKDTELKEQIKDGPNFFQKMENKNYNSKSAIEIKYSETSELANSEDYPNFEETFSDTDNMSYDNFSDKQKELQSEELLLQKWDIKRFNLDSREFGSVILKPLKNNLLDKITKLTDQNTSSKIEFNLSPKYLGSVQVHMEFSEQKTVQKLHIVLDTKPVYEMFIQHAKELKNSLDLQNIDVNTSIEFSFKEGGKGEQRNQKFSNLKISEVVSQNNSMIPRNLNAIGLVEQGHSLGMDVLRKIDILV